MGICSVWRMEQESQAESGEDTDDICRQAGLQFIAESGEISRNAWSIGILRLGSCAQWHPACRWHFTLGGMFDLFGGALYLMRNSNNPVTPLAYAGIDLTASASFRFRFGRLPVVVRDVVRIPSAGAFFSPQYGETMYEIYLGNRKDLVHFGWWGNSFGIDNMLAFDLMFGRKFLAAWLPTRPAHIQCGKS